MKLLADDDNSNNDFNQMVNTSSDDEHVNSSSTANQEMNNGKQKDFGDKSECNATMSVNNNHTTATRADDDAKIKRE
jgi:hypothetical protein